MMITQKFNIYLHAGIAFAPVVHASQYSQGETWTFTILDNDGSVYRPSSGALIGVKADGRAVAGITGTVNADGSVSIVTTQQLTAAAGRGLFELTIDGGTNGTANFIIEVEKKPTDDAILSESDLSIIQQGMNSVTPQVIQETVSDYLAEHMTNPPIDPTLTVSNAAADAKVTGDKITDLKNAIHALSTNQNEDIYLVWEQGTISSNDGSEISSELKIRTGTIDLNDYSDVTFNNTNGYKFRTVWLDNNGDVVREAASAAERTVTSVSYGFMSRYGITAVRIVLGKTDDSAISTGDGSMFTVTGVPKIKTTVKAVKNTLKNNFSYDDTDYKQLPITELNFSVGDLNNGEISSGYRPYTDLFIPDSSVVVRCTDYPVFVAMYNADGTYKGRITWSHETYIPYSEGMKIRLMFDNESHSSNSTSPQIDDIISSDLSISIKKETKYISDSVDAVIQNMDGQNGNSLNIAFLTDLHVTAFEDMKYRQIAVWNRNTNGIAKVDTLRNIDFIVLGGDYLWNNTNTTLERAETAYKLLQSDFYKFKEKQFALKGNHDDNSIAGSTDYLVSDSKRYGYLGQQYTNDVIIKYGNAEKSYGYIDFKRQKVRAVFINSVDIPSTYSGQHITGVGNNQLNFIADALTFSDSGWAVIFFSHHLLIDNRTMNPQPDYEGYVIPTHGGDALWGMIQAFKNKTTYTKVSTLTDFEYSVSVDFTNNASDTIIASISGHTHRDLSATQDGVLLISTTACGIGQTAYDSTGAQISRTLGTQSETSFDIYSVDRINGTLKATRYGAGQNRNWTI